MVTPARRFFQQYSVSANIMNIDADIMKRLHTTLATMSYGYDVNSSKFKTFCWETASLYVDLYPWYPMIQTLHRILIHGYEVIELFTLPLGMFLIKKNLQNFCFGVFGQKISFLTHCAL